MTIDEAIAHAREVANNESCEKCAKEHEQLAEWLEELKIYKESNISVKTYQQGRADAIEEYKIALHTKYKENKDFAYNVLGS